MKEVTANLYQLVYKSYATKALTVEEFADLLVDARVKNDALGITGILLYKTGVFVQLLEGDKKDIEELFEIIKGDARHTQVKCLHFQPATHRVCKGWAMKIHNLDFGSPANLNGLENIITELNKHTEVLSDKQNKSLAKDLIALFEQAS